MQEIIKEINELKTKLNVLLVSHFYQRDEVVKIADFSGDSLELAKKASEDSRFIVVFCGVNFMGQSVKILAPQKRVLMPRAACCSMARMIDCEYFDTSIAKLKKLGISEVLPLAYINSSAEVKARVGELGGCVCTSGNAKKIFAWALNEISQDNQNKRKIFFLPDRCLGQNLAAQNGLKSAILGQASDEEILNADIICYDGFCSVHQLFSSADIDFYREKYSDILIAVHPECDPSVVACADFVGSTSEIIKFVQNLPQSQKVAVGTEFNLVNRLRKDGFNGEQNTFVLSSSKPECPTMNETTLEDVLACLKSIKGAMPLNEVQISPKVAKFAKIALDKMMELSK